MEAGVVIALIGAAVSLLGAVISMYTQFGLERWKVNRQAQATLAKYREPLIYAAYELQSRLYNIVRGRFLQTYYVNGNNYEQEYALENTLYAIAQYFAWTEILRQEIQFLNLGEVKSTRKVAKLQEDISKAFLSDASKYGGPVIRVFRGEQRAIGERMIVSQGDHSTCRGYASFVDDKSETLRQWFEQLQKDIDTIARALAQLEEETGTPVTAPLWDFRRLVELQHRLIALIDFLDPDCMRFSEQQRQLICKHDEYCLKPHDPPLQPYDVCEECFAGRN